MWLAVNRMAVRFRVREVRGWGGGGELAEVRVPVAVELADEWLGLGWIGSGSRRKLRAKLAWPAKAAASAPTAPKQTRKLETTCKSSVRVCLVGLIPHARLY